MNTITLDLYQDLCTSNSIIPNLETLTKKQVDTLISLEKNGLRPEYTLSGSRRWIIPGKKKQGGYLTQRFSQKFFSSEN